MRAAISTDEEQVSAHFGRCISFTIVEIEHGKVVSKKVIDNPGHQPGFLPQFLKKQGVDTVIAGGMGQRALKLFEQAGIKVIVGVEGTIEEVIDKLLRGTLRGGESLCKSGSGKGYGVEKRECDHHFKSKVATEASVSCNKIKKICITSQGKNLDSLVDLRFGRCNYFIIVNSDTLEFQALENPNKDLQAGAGIASAQFIVDKGVDVVLTGNVGPNALEVLQSVGVEVITGVSGSVREVMEKFRNH